MERELLLPSGSTMFNLACSGDPNGFSTPGVVMNLIGDSNAGKSFLSRTIMAAIMQTYGDAYRYYYEDYERASFFDDAKLFGESFSQRLEPAWDYGTPPTIEEFYGFFTLACNKAIEEQKPFIYVLDSWDALRSMEDKAVLEEMASGGEKKSRGQAKQKNAALMFSDMMGKLEQSKSMLIVVSQAKEEQDPKKFEKKTRSGGASLRYYSTLEVWLSTKERIRKDDLIVGNVCGIKVKRSRLTGKVREVGLPILQDYGVDDTQSMIDWLEEQKIAKKTGMKLNIEELGVCAMPGKIASVVEAEGKVDALRELVAREWHSRETTLVEKLLQGRKPKFS